MSLVSRAFRWVLRRSSPALVPAGSQGQPSPAPPPARVSAAPPPPAPVLPSTPDIAPALTEAQRKRDVLDAHCDTLLEAGAAPAAPLPKWRETPDGSFEVLLTMPERAAMRVGFDISRQLRGLPSTAWRGQA